MKKVICLLVLLQTRGMEIVQILLFQIIRYLLWGIIGHKVQIVDVLDVFH